MGHDAMIETLFVHRLDIVLPTVTTDRYGDQVLDWDHPRVVKLRGWVAQNASDEDRANRTADIGDWVAFVPPSAPVGGECKIRWVDPTFNVTRYFEVVGPPTPAHTPNGPHHIEVPMREVQG